MNDMPVVGILLAYSRAFRDRLAIRARERAMRARWRWHEDCGLQGAVFRTF
jgi:hypothetical protein